MQQKGTINERSLLVHNSLPVTANFETKKLVAWLVNTPLILAARSIRQVMDREFSFLLCPKREAPGPSKQGRKKRGSITCRTDWANEVNKMFIIWLCWLFRFWKGDWELEVRTATYGPGIDQSQYTKSASHKIEDLILLLCWKTSRKCKLCWQCFFGKSITIMLPMTNYTKKLC